MAKNSIRDYSATVGNNTDIQSVNIDEGCSPAGINNAIREMMVDLANVNSGAVSLVSPDFDTATIGGTAIDSFPSGTKMLFNQTAAPTGWTKDTTHNDKALRITNGTVGTGGTVAFETALSSQSVGGTVTVAEHTLTIAEMPSHTHTLNYDFVLGITDNSRTTSPPTADGGSGSVADQPEWTASNTGGGDGHSHGATFSGTAIDLDVQYVDVIIASKD